MVNQEKFQQNDTNDKNNKTNLIKITAHTVNGFYYGTNQPIQLILADKFILCYVLQF